MPVAKIIKKWNVPENGLKMYKLDGTVICVSDFKEEKNFVINQYAPMVAVYKKRGEIPRFKYEKIFSKLEDLNEYFQRVRGQDLCAN